MDIRNCRGCGKMIQYMGSGPLMCVECRKKLDESFARVKEYLKEYPNCSINELSENAEVSITQINQWIREERLIFSKNSPIGIPCESCGKTIKSGRYCKECKDSLVKALGGGPKSAPAPASKPSGSTKAKMRFLDR